MDLNDTPELAEYRAKVRGWLEEHAAEAPQRRGREDPDSVAAHRAWQGKLAAAGLAAVTWPAEYGGQGLGPLYQVVVNQEIGRAGVPGLFDVIGVGMLGPTLIAHGTEDQKQRHLGPMLAGEEVWCQLFSEPAAGSDLAGVQARAKRHDDGSWTVSGQKVWTTNAQHASFGLLLARTDPDVPKHRGITYFLCDMTDPGIEVRPLRQITGEAEFNEVFITDVRIPDSRRLGDVGDGWKVAQTTLNNERVAIGGMRLPREGGMIGPVARTWRERPELRTHDLHQRLLKLWVEAEAARLTAERLRQQLVAGQPGPEGAGMKLAFARLNQEISGLEVELRGEEGLLYDDWTMRRPELVDFVGRDAGYRYLRSKGNSIEGGTTEVLLNIVAERVLGLPPEPRTDKDVAWKDLAR
jgi:alkylation response protein AidB-like acyl-CoA dehydrogenase